jgi:CheY-like chemotaxis protein
MHDPRKPRALKPRTVHVLVLDANTFSRGLICEILRSLDVTNVHGARDEMSAMHLLYDQPIDLILISSDEGDSVDALGAIRNLRRLPNDRLRRLPVVLVTAGLTRQLVINGRDAGADEFLAKPISPVAMRQRLEMVIETPRPFIDCSVFVGPCRRRKNPADYHGAKRRDGDRPEEPASTLVDADEVAAQSPIRLALAALRQGCADIRGSQPNTMAFVRERFKAAKDIAASDKDKALSSALAAFEAYVSIQAPLGQLDPIVVSTALTAMEQLSMLPLSYTEARDSVALALGKAIHKKLAA